ncbi:Parathyroid hormone 2 receptor [Bulinus truncatus]|nr:Parathyroid hormone 2 receptor [Bulinus truncatus]
MTYFISKEINLSCLQFPGHVPLYDNVTGVRKCEMVWDNILCWDPTPADTISQQPCPGYINQFNTSAMATKYCTTNGTWFHHPTFNKKWTDYRACYTQPDLSQHIEHGERLQLIMTIGYGVSLCSLVLAVIIMCCSRLKSKSNTLHVNLFLAFIFRAVLSFAKQLLFVQGMGLEKDIRRLDDGSIGFIYEGSYPVKLKLRARLSYLNRGCRREELMTGGMKSVGDLYAEPFQGQISGHWACPGPPKFNDGRTQKKKHCELHIQQLTFYELIH